MRPELAQLGGIFRLALHHLLARALDDAAHAALAHEHVVRFLGQHEPARARERIEARFRERRELVLAVAIGEVREHEERQPVRSGLVERAQDARIVGVARAALEQAFRFLAAVAPEVRLQQVHHRPQVPAFLDVHLEEIAQVVQRRAGEPEVALLLDRCRLGVALRDDQAAQVGPMLARHFLPRRLALARAEVHLASGFRGIEEDAPAVLRHLHVVEVRPALGIHADRGAQVHVDVAGAFRAHVGPPVLELGLPVLERALQRAVAREIDVVRNLFGVIDAHRKSCGGC